MRGGEAPPDYSPLKNLRLFWLSTGDKDKSFAAIEGLHDTLAKANIPHTWHIDSGTHEWPVWKNDLYFLSQMLFREP
jgi:enterochelin esterase-like enzyme